MGGDWLDAPHMDRSSREQFDGNDRSFVDSRCPGGFQKPERRLILCSGLFPSFSIRSPLAYGKVFFVQSPRVESAATARCPFANGRRTPHTMWGTIRSWSVFWSARHPSTAMRGSGQSTGVSRSSSGTSNNQCRA